ncbi:uncharacterized protein LOC118504733 [Anopheles stephensi]|uniref:uncharacterized protein LOC118504733 n=1 Tax=Anopheles stephensi TaxID=30069 RepID=UPI0016587B01|nr:uncharacterized protein LOC118504733 [Anopheles stephensi]XP_035895508.1 uncharacterized protein LOC118504733 [Anopheles stephensi]XP_035895518.1 uncharacterized protein LOC118504733 [Anopheles stephensi]
MKKFMTTKVSAVVPTTPSPTPSPSMFSFDAMVLQQAADRNGSSTSPGIPERNEDNDTNGDDEDDTGSMPSVRQPPPTPTAILASNTIEPKDLGKPAKGSGRVLAADTPTSSTTTSSTGVVKMCGYLKKKRNKMGGWRKLFFILQNQLLLSYSSRDDYEKKLAPFKDIINLVPGTVIIPTTGPRFTIETNSKLMYTFRCDDHRSCSEWIMALLDSLTVANGGISADRNFSLHNSFQRATLPLASFSLPSNCKPFAGIISRPCGPAPLGVKKRAPQPPSRPGPPKPPRSFSAEASDRYRMCGPDRESMDKDDLNNNVLKVVRPNGSTAHEDRKSLATESRSNLLRDSDTKVAGTGGPDEPRRSPESAVVPLEAAKDTKPDQSTRGRTELRDRPEHCVKSAAVDGVDGAASANGTGEERAERHDRRPRQQIFRLHQDVVWSKSHHQSMDVCRINSMFNERQPSLTASVQPSVGECTTTATIKSTASLPSASGSVPDRAPSCNLHVYEEVGVSGVLMEPEPIYAVVDVRAKRSRRLARTLDTGADEPDGRVNGGRKVSVSLPQISDGVELVTVTERRPVAARSCSNYDDYEDVNYLFETRRSVAGGTETDSVGTNGSHDPLPTHHRQEPYDAVDEHIYEPIQVSDRIPSVTTGSSSSLPAPTEHHHNHGLWRQLKRMQLQGSWRRLTLRTGTTPAPPKPQSGASSPPPPASTRSATVTALEGLGRRFDSHRRSIKKRIKNLCERIDPIPSATSSTGRQPSPNDVAPEPATAIAPEPSTTGVQSRKSVSLDSFLLAKGHQGRPVPKY